MGNTEPSCKHYKNNIWLCSDGSSYDTRKKAEALSTPTSGYKRLSVGTFLHRAIYETFIGAIPPKFCVNHINGDKQDNRVENLEAISYRDNSRHASHVLKVSNNEVVSKITETQVLEIVDLLRHSQIPVKQLAVYYQISAQAIHRINDGLNWTRVTCRRCNDYPIRSKGQATLKRGAVLSTDDIVCSLAKVRET